MTSFLIKRFVKNYTDVSDTRVRGSYGLLAGIAGIVCNVLLFAFKLLAGILAGSVSVIADAVNNLSDASTCVMSFLGFKLSQRPADSEHPYGHGRYEYIAGIIVAVMIIVIGVELLREGVGKIIHPSVVSFSALTFVILICSILVKLWMMVFYRRIGKTINSETLIATSADSRNDVISSLAVLAGAAVSKVWGVTLDGWIGVAVSVFVIVSGILAAKDTLDPVLGRAPDPKTVADIKEKIMRYEGVIGTHDLMVHDYGPGRQFASVHVEMPADGDPLAMHEIIDKIERDFLENEGLRMIVHYDPIPSSDSEMGSLREWICGEMKKLDERITVHDLGMNGNMVRLDCVIPPDVTIGDDEIEKHIKDAVKAKYPDAECKIRIDRSFAEIAE